MATDLEAFFAAMKPFLWGETSAENVVERLGACPSGVERLRTYRRLVAGDTAHILGQMFPAVQRAAERFEPGLWGKLIHKYARKHPPTHFEVNRYGDAFPDFLEEERLATPTLPAYLPELADFHAIRYHAANALDAVQGQLDQTLFVRQYAYTSPEYALRVIDGADPEPPAPGAVLAVVYRSYLTLKPQVLYPSLPALLALARRVHLPMEREDFKTVDGPSIDAAERDLVARGVLGPEPR